MNFTVERKTLIKMLRLLTEGSVRENDHLRIAAQGGRLTLTLEDGSAETSFEASVAEKGVCFFRHKKLVPLLRSYKDAKSLTVEVTADGIQIGSTSISRGFWEVSLFDDPATAPLTLPMLPASKATDKAVEAKQKQLPL